MYYIGCFPQFSLKHQVHNHSQNHHIKVVINYITERLQLYFLIHFQHFPPISIFAKVLQFDRETEEEDPAGKHWLDLAQPCTAAHKLHGGERRRAG